MKYFLLLLFVQLGYWAIGQTNLELGYYLNTSKFPSDQISTIYVKGNSDAILAYTQKHQLKYKGSHNGFHTITLTKQALKLLSQQSFITYIQFSLSKGRVLNDSTRVINRVEPILDGDTSLLQPYTGNGILMAIIDGGIDFNHRDFQFADSSTRVLKYWKQHAPNHPTLTPSNFGYGQSYDSSMINAGTVGLGAQFIDHGCTVTGSAAGNSYANGRHKGMAPETDLIIVSSDFNIPNWKASIADAVEYILEISDSLNKPVVINASLGDYLGSHDGLDPSALRIDSMLNAKPGRLMVCAGGNSGAIGAYHLKTSLSNTDTSFTWFEHNPSTNLGFPGVFVELWGDTADLSQVEFALASDNIINGYERRGLSNFHQLHNNLGTIVEDTIWNGGNALATVQLYMEQRNGQYMVQIAIPNPDSSQYTIALVSKGTGIFDTWSGSWLGTNDMITQIPSLAQYPIINQYTLPDTLSTLVDSWACSPNVITVGNYYSRLSYFSFGGTFETVAGTKNEISISSSKGPTRNGYQKPDIAATGDMALSAASISTLNYHQTNDPTKLDSGGMHIRNGGTSMASPILAGIAALYLEKCPKAFPVDFITAVHQSARSDSYTGTLPNYAFGYGKVDGLGVLQHSNFKPLITGDDFFCINDSTSLLGTSHDSILWSNNSSNVQTYISTPQNVWLDAQNTQGCKAVSDTLTIFQAPTPPKPLITHISNGLTSSPAFDYQWYFNGTILQMANTQQHIAQNSGYYQVETSNQYGCTRLSDSLFISLVHVEEYALEANIYPNPTKETVTVTNSGEAFVRLYDSYGKLLYSQSFDRTIELDLRALSDGVYIVELSNDVTSVSRRIIKQ